jgi:hypothetical protein
VGSFLQSSIDHCSCSSKGTTLNSRFVHDRFSVKFFQEAHSEHRCPLSPTPHLTDNHFSLIPSHLSPPGHRRPHRIVSYLLYAFIPSSARPSHLRRPKEQSVCLAESTHMIVLCRFHGSLFSPTFSPTHVKIRTQSVLNWNSIKLRSLPLSRPADHRFRTRIYLARANPQSQPLPSHNLIPQSWVSHFRNSSTSSGGRRR